MPEMLDRIRLAQEILGPPPKKRDEVRDRESAVAALFTLFGGGPPRYAGMFAAGLTAIPIYVDDTIPDGEIRVRVHDKETVIRVAELMVEPAPPTMLMDNPTTAGLTAVPRGRPTARAVGDNVNMRPGITVIVPTIPGREEMYARAADSVQHQTLRPKELLVAMDTHGWGAAAMRDQLLADVDTEWVAPLDDDDYLYPHHLNSLWTAVTAGADIVYPWYDVSGPTEELEQWRDPHAKWEGIAWDPAHPHQVPVTFLARTGAVRAAGGWTNFGTFDPLEAGTDLDGNRAGEDYLLILRLNAAGARIVHHPHRTWRWRHHLSNTSGVPPHR